MRFALIFSFLALISCVDMPVSEVDNRNVTLPYEKLDGVNFSKETIHFIVKSYSMEINERYSSQLENFYSSIMQDTGLYSFIPQKPYEIIVYKDKNEYMLKTKSPDFSSALTYGNAIATYEQENYTATLAHELTHVIFNEFMENYNMDSFLFINEGLAVYEERKFSSSSDFYYSDIIRSYVKSNPIPFIELINYKPRDNNNTEYVKKWYAQCSNIVEYMIKNYGSLKFSIFLKDIKKGYDLNSALRDAYSGIFNDYKDLENRWLGSL